MRITSHWEATHSVQNIGIQRLMDDIGGVLPLNILSGAICVATTNTHIFLMDRNIIGNARNGKKTAVLSPSPVSSDQ
jgi:hypothetical protein